MHKHKPIILSLGGSLIYPNRGIDTKFLSQFNQFIRRQVKKGRRFFIVTGGGFPTRHYQQAAARVLPDVPDEDLDWLGIHTTRVNAHLIRTVFRDIARPKIIEHYEKKQEIGDYSVVVGSGWKPGWSTNYDAAVLAKFYKAKVIIKTTSIGKVYTADPRKDSSAKPLKRVSWGDYLKIIGEKWVPGGNFPFDPMASKLAEKIGARVFVLDGRDLTNLERAIEGKRFVGTVIE